MKTTTNLCLGAALVLCIATSSSTLAMAQGMQGMGADMMQEGSASRATTSNMPEHGMRQGMMCPMMGGMMQGGMGQGMMGSNMMGQGMMGSDTTRGGTGGMFGSHVTPMMNLSVEDVRSYLGVQLERLNNKRLKIGNVSADGGSISAAIVTVDNSLVQNLKVDRHTGTIEYEN
ncbi:hypothetical protein [Bradyrhizobium zhanjiangense]|uniref:PepSY domain-containing protein n=1 Tax=Bradyrhizobium zhanjiangense TaxID=1325107 RepID=A0A4Q0SRZ5_9BRAD|nr:hypothetical protein [Bradyrhizobium zhanjiangense]RXH42597.1 hypothetical protein XH94_01710 [Bradyrhizobium zhanjiangense]